MVVITIPLPRVAPLMPSSRMSLSTPAASHFVASSVQYHPKLLGSIDAVVGLVPLSYENFELFVSEGSIGGFSSLVVIVRRGGEVQHCTDRLDPPLVPIRVDERHYLFRLVPG